MDVKEEQSQFLISDFNSLSGKEMKVAIGQFSVSTILFRDGTGNVTGFGGYMYEQLLWISLHLNFSLSMNVLENDKPGFTDLWTELKEKIRREEVDIACNAFPGLDLQNFFKLAILATSDSIGILAPYPVPRTSKYGPILIFSRDIWITLLISILAIIGFIQLMMKLIQKYLQREPVNSRGFRNFSDTFIYIFSTLTNQGGYFINGNRSIGTIAGIWCFATFVFVNIYSTCLTSYMSLTFQRPEINSFHDMLMNKDHTFLTFKGGPAEFMFLEAKYGMWKEFGDRLRRCPENRCTLASMELTARKALESKSVAILPVSFIENYMYQTFRIRHECRVTMAQEIMASRHYFMVVNKKNPFDNDLNKASYWWHALGLQTYWRRKLLNVAPQCRLKYNNNGESVQLVDKARIKLEQLYVAFAVLFIGYTLAFVQFVREQFIRWCFHI